MDEQKIRSDVVLTSTGVLTEKRDITFTGNTVSFLGHDDPPNPPYY